MVVRNLGDNPTKTYYHIVPSNVSRAIADIKFVVENELKYSKVEVVGS